MGNTQYVGVCQHIQERYAAAHAGGTSAKEHNPRRREVAARIRARGNPKATPDDLRLRSDSRARERTFARMQAGARLATCTVLRTRGRERATRAARRGDHERNPLGTNDSTVQAGHTPGSHA